MFHTYYNNMPNNMDARFIGGRLKVEYGKLALGATNVELVRCLLVTVMTSACRKSIVLHEKVPISGKGHELRHPRHGRMIFKFNAA